MADMVRLLKRIADAAGCTRYCSLTGDEHPASPLFRVVHNGVSFSRRVDIDMYLVVTAEDCVEETLTAWLKAHHAGDQRIPFAYRRPDGTFAIVAEAEDEARCVEKQSYGPCGSPTTIATFQKAP